MTFAHKLSFTEVISFIYKLSLTKLFLCFFWQEF